MSCKSRSAVWAAFLWGVAQAALAQTPTVSPAQNPASQGLVAPAAAAPSPVSSPAAAPPLRALAGTVIRVEITQAVSSKTNKRGDSFTLRLAEPIVVDGQVLVPAGATGVGEVIDSAPPGLSGTPGKLVLAARYLEYQGARIPLRTLRLGGAGTDHTRLATGVAFAVGLPAMLITGGDLDIPVGTQANAKLGADYPPAGAAPVAPSAVSAAPAPVLPSASVSPAAAPANQGTQK